MPETKHTQAIFLLNILKFHDLVKDNELTFYAQVCKYNVAKLIQ